MNSPKEVHHIEIDVNWPIHILGFLRHQDIDISKEQEATVWRWVYYDIARWYTISEEWLNALAPILETVSQDVELLVKRSHLRVVK